MYTYKIEQAIKAAAILHDGQLRKGNVPLPYITHLYAVAMILESYTDDEDTIVAGLLHDTIEDTDYTPKELEADFGKQVCEAVLAVTEPVEDLSWKEAKKQYAKQLKKAPERSLMVAAADKIHNMRSIVEDYYTDHTRFKNDFKGSLEDRMLMYQDISNVLNARLSNDIIAEFNHVYTEYKNFIVDVKKTTEKSK
ncbi:MAG: HD domain-containing protein [Candidatus Paceibacterota bacterium]